MVDWEEYGGTTMPATT